MFFRNFSTKNQNICLKLVFLCDLALEGSKIDYTKNLNLLSNFKSE